jgi:hypothetical protein
MYTRRIDVHSEHLGTCSRHSGNQRPELLRTRVNLDKMSIPCRLEDVS